ncbi:MAG: DUF58 domain-containing protein [Planctomycetes bacterium]|nr:DUF58 domain-containing protein [Planctomycetota bacterium]
MPPTSSPSALLPEIARKFGHLELIARHAVEGLLQGQHRSPHKGFSIEFAEHRLYTPGDDLRYVDWLVYARTDNFYIIQYEAETNCQIYALVDMSGSMGFGSATVSKLLYATYCAAAIAYLVVKQRDKFGLMLFDQVIHQHLEPRSTPGHLSQVLRALDRLQPGSRSDFPGVFQRFGAALRHRSLILLFSDLFQSPEEIGRGLATLRYSGHGVAVFQILDHAELAFPYRGFTSFEGLEEELPVEADPAAVREDYLREINAHLTEIRRLCAAHDIDYVLADTSQPFDRVLRGYLESRAAFG